MKKLQLKTKLLIYNLKIWRVKLWYQNGSYKCSKYQINCKKFEMKKKIDGMNHPPPSKVRTDPQVKKLYLNH